MAKKVKFKPFGAWILLPNPAKTITDSGIILDETPIKILLKYNVNPIGIKTTTPVIK